MTQGADLLRMLEPAVRPGASLPSKPAAAGHTPFESQDFETLLASAQDAQDQELEGARAEKKNQNDAADPLKVLAGIDRVENPGLRDLLAARTPKPEPLENPSNTTLNPAA